MSRVDNLNCISNTAVLTFCFFPCCVRVITLLDEVCHLTKTYELVTNDMIFIKKGDDANTAWEKAKGQSGRVADAVKIIDPREQ